MKKLQPVRGTKDILEEDADIFRHVIETFEITTYEYGFREIQTPIIEDSEVFKKTLGLTSDIIKKETYTFKDKSNNEITLRPEGTAPVIRFFINNKLHHPLPQKFNYSGPMFRYDRPQQGRLRQFHQLGAEIIGEKDISADLELICIAKEFINTLEISSKEYKIHVNSLGNEESRKKYSIKLKNFFQDYKKELTTESLERLKKNPLRILDTKNKEEKKLLTRAPKLKDFLSSESSDIFEKFKQECKELQIPIFVNDNLVRGLDYYNNICYEFIGSQDAFLAGGRYDGLIKRMGGPDYPGCGFAIGIERIRSMIMNYDSTKWRFQAHLKLPHKHYIAIAVGKENKFKAMKIINEIRKKEARKHQIIINLICKDNLSKGLKYASEKEASYAIIIGEDEILKKQLTIKDLITEEQKKIKIIEFGKHLTDLI